MHQRFSLPLLFSFLKISFVNMLKHSLPGAEWTSDYKLNILFVFRVMAELEDSSGLLKASTNAGQAARSALSKVQALVNSQEAFDEELNG